MEWKTSPIRIRWFNDACYEIVLPNEVTLLVDPYIDKSPLKKLGSDALERVDYVLISHAHFDHVLDLPTVLERFQPQIFVGHLSAVEVAVQFDIPGRLMNLCVPGETYQLNGATLTCLHGKHTALPDFDRPSHWEQNLFEDNLPQAHKKMNLLGSYEYTNFVLTLPNHIRFLIWGGGATPEGIRQVADVAPNISIMQLPREPVEQVAALYAAAGGQFIFPHHHDSFMAKGPEGLAVIEETVHRTHLLAPETQVILPEKGEWYEFSTCMSAVF